MAYASGYVRNGSEITLRPVLRLVILFWTDVRRINTRVCRKLTLIHAQIQLCYPNRLRSGGGIQTNAFISDAIERNNIRDVFQLSRLELC